MSNDYRNNHYVPRWYQERFIPNEQEKKEFFYLDLKPGVFVDPRGISHPKKAVHVQGSKFCFVTKDLYTTKFGSEESTEVEQIFFGSIDNNGRKAVEYFSNFVHPDVNEKALIDLLVYMSTQKMRTPKGLDWISSQFKTHERENILKTLMSLRQLFCAVWTESVWQIADASKSETKFIISDHPVTVYNRRCGPRSQWCRGSNDPDIRFHGTHTIFPLSLEKILILTNLSWVRNPYQKETDYRPNPSLFRETIFNFTSIQTSRFLNEQEVREINFIIKNRAYRYIAAAKEEWIYPEKYVSKSSWNIYGNGYLFMPDPRPVNFGSEILLGYKDGTTVKFDDYGRRPWQKDYAKENRTFQGADTLQRFQGEFARLFGPVRRGLTFELGCLDKEKDDDKYHQYHLSLEKKRNGKQV